MLQGFCRWDGIVFDSKCFPFLLNAMMTGAGPVFRIARRIWQLPGRSLPSGRMGMGGVARLDHSNPQSTVTPNLTTTGLRQRVVRRQDLKQAQPIRGPRPARLSKWMLLLPFLIRNMFEYRRDLLIYQETDRGDDDPIQPHSRLHSGLLLLRLDELVTSYYRLSFS